MKRNKIPHLAHLFYFSLLLLSGCFMPAVAQTRHTIAGVVSDTSGTPLTGISVSAKKSGTGIQTDSNGRFSMNAATGEVLQFSGVGYELHEYIVRSSQTGLKIVLTPSADALNQVIVIGYGTQKKADLTGSVASIREKEFNSGINASPQQLIIGKAPGVRVVQSGGEPGGGMSISIRGAGSITAGTQPLYVIDGVPLQNAAPVDGGGPGFSSAFTPRNPLSAINPSDIVSFEILKDASATAIYGSRGANGVVLITTKSGSSGKMKVDYDGYSGLQSPFRQPKLLNPQQYMRIINQMIDEGAANSSNKVTEITEGGTNWQEELYNKKALFQSHDLSFSGGDKATKYRVSLSYLNQPGVLINSALERYNGRINLDHTIQDKFKMGLRMNYSYNKDTYLANGTGFNESAGALNAALNYDPTISVFDMNGKYTISPFITVDNPLAIANGYQSGGNRFQFLGNVFGEYFFTKNWSAKLNVGVDNYTEDRKTYISRVSQFGLASGGVANVLHGGRSSYLAELTTHYRKTIGEHAIDGLLGTSFQDFINTNSLATGRGFPSDAVGAENLALGDPALATNSSFKSNNRLLSYIGRLNYGFDDRYLLTATLRIDGSSRFGANNKFGYFPSFAAGWKISNEQFFEPLTNIFHSAKLRASWGRTGNQAIGNYNSLATYAAGQMAVFDDQLVSTMVPSRLPNPDLKWETTTQTDIGLDLEFWSGRVAVSADYYQKNTTDMLINLPVDRSTGFNSQLRNIGSMKNQGFEFSISSENLVNKFKWRTSANLSTMRNRVTDIGGLNEIIEGSAIIKVGHPLRSFYGFQIIGTWQTNDDHSAMNETVLPGDPKYLDLNGDKVINTSDRVILGNSFPELSYGIGNYFSYGRFDFNFFIDGVSGVESYNVNLAESMAPANIRRNRYAEPFLNRWTTDNPTNHYPSFIRQQGSRGVSSYTVTDASFIRLNNVQLSYTFPGGALGNWNRSARIYIAAQNVAIISDYLGDPTINTGGGANFNDSNNPYPLARTILFGISLGL